MNIQIAAMTPDHFPNVIDLWNRTDGVVLTATDNPQDLKAYLDHNPGLSQVALNDGAVVGAVLAGHDGRRGYLHHLAVTPECRRQKIGTRLVEASIQHFEARGISHCNLFLLNDNHVGQQFWSKFRFNSWPNLRLMSRSVELNSESIRQPRTRPELEPELEIDPGLAAGLTLEANRTSFQYHKDLADKAIAQVPDAKMHTPIDENTNSIVVIMKHVAGNLRSRWTDFLTTDGEKPWRDRDTEFVDDFSSHAELMSYWNAGWDCLFATLDSLQAQDMLRKITIRGEQHAVPLAMSRSLAHTSYHVGQIVILARHHVPDGWETLTIARGKSQQFNQQNWREQ